MVAALLAIGIPPSFNSILVSSESADIHSDIVSSSKVVTSASYSFLVMANV